MTHNADINLSSFNFNYIDGVNIVKPIIITWGCKREYDCEFAAASMRPYFYIEIKSCEVRCKPFR